MLPCQHKLIPFLGTRLVLQVLDVDFIAARARYAGSVDGVEPDMLYNTTNDGGTKNAVNNRFITGSSAVYLPFINGRAIALPVEAADQCNDAYWFLYTLFMQGMSGKQNVQIVSGITCRVQNLAKPRAGRVGGHSWVARQSRAGLDANRSVSPGYKPPPYLPKHR